MLQRTEILTKGHYRVRFAIGSGDLASSLALRTLCFGRTATDSDALDEICSHVLIEDCRTDKLVAAFRMLEIPHGGEINQSYSAQYYGLSSLAKFPGAMIELGRFCVHPDCTDPDVLRLAWGALARLVDERGVQMLFGCSSFMGTEVERYLEVFKLLKVRHLAPARWLPQVKMERVFPFAKTLQGKPNVKKAFVQMPALLRSYLMMGGWVSDHAVVDVEMNTLHVFTGVEVHAIPASRKRLLRAIAE